MRRALLTLLVVLSAVSAAAAAELPNSYKEARALWDKTKNAATYDTYSAQFAQRLNASGINVKSGCFAMGPGPVDLMLVITQTGTAPSATVERVYSDSDGPKASCFRKSFMGIPAQRPPYLPFVMNMQMG